MKLQSRIILMLLPVLIAYGCFDYFIQRTVIMPSFLALEKDQAGKDLQRCVEALQRELHHLGQFTNDWAAWDDSYRFIHERNPEYVASNLGVQTFIDNRLNAIFYIDHTGRIVWGETHDSVSGTLQHCPEITDQFIPRLHQLLPTDEKGGSLKGILLTEADPLLIAVRPILASDHSGPTRGHLIMGRFLNADLIKHLNDQTGVTHQVKPVADDLLPLSAVGPDGSTRLNGSFHMEGDESHLSVSTIIEDIYGTPALVVEARLAREIFARGLSTVNTSRVSDLAAGIVLLLVLIVLLRWIVLHPLAHLTRHAIKLRQSADLTLRCDFKRSDEIGLLSHEFDLLVGELQKSRANLEAMVLKRTAALLQANTQLQTEVAERKKAETALHRINGDLEQLVADRTANLVRANTQLKGEFSKRLQHEKRLKTYHAKLRSLSSELLLAEERERRRIATELHDHIGQTLTISKLKIDALCESIQAPESARELEAVGRLIEQSIQDARTLTFELSPPVLYVLGLESALEWLAEKFQKQHRLVIVLEDDEKPKPLGDATKVLMFQSCRELLFNIVKHAGAQNVKLTLKRIENNFRLDVVDDGGGFDPTRVLAFNHRDCGFGLFSIRERLHHHGGRLEIHSTPGKGARMALICPLEQSQISQPRVEVAL